MMRVHKSPTGYAPNSLRCTLRVQTASRREPSAPAFTLDPEEASSPPPGARASQYAGVHWDSDTSKWKAFPSISGQVLLQQLGWAAGHAL